LVRDGTGLRVQVGCAHPKLKYKEKKKKKKKKKNTSPSSKITFPWFDAPRETPSPTHRNQTEGFETKEQTAIVECKSCGTVACKTPTSSIAKLSHRNSLHERCTKWVGSGFVGMLAENAGAPRSAVLKLNRKAYPLTSISSG